jgi:hypothetical protein
MPDRKQRDLIHAVAKADELSVIATLVVRQLEREMAAEPGGREQVERARRGAAALLGHCVKPEGASADTQQSPWFRPSQSPKPQRQRVPRPKLAKKIGDAWGTQEGQNVLVSLPMRQLKKHFGVSSHASFYDVPLFNHKIRPLRERLLRVHQAKNWMERNARGRP